VNGRVVSSNVLCGAHHVTRQHVHPQYYIYIYIYICDAKFLALLGAPYIYDIGRLRVTKNFQLINYSNDN
jgi:hypothetical protein